MQEQSEIAALDVFRHDVDRTVVRSADVVDGNDMGVIEPSEDPSLDQERVRIAFGAKSTGHRDFDSDAPLELVVDPKPNLSEASFAQNPDQPIAPIRTASSSLVA